MNRAVFFDVDGTLTEMPSLERRYFRALRREGKFSLRNGIAWLAEFVRLQPNGLTYALQGNASVDPDLFGPAKAELGRVIDLLRGRALPNLDEYHQEPTIDPKTKLGHPRGVQRLQIFMNRPAIVAGVVGFYLATSHGGYTGPYVANKPPKDWRADRRYCDKKPLPALEFVSRQEWDLSAPRQEVLLTLYSEICSGRRARPGFSVSRQKPRASSTITISKAKVTPRTRSRYQLPWNCPLASLINPV